MSEKPVSIFNEVLGPVMRGPSSSHTAAAYRLGAMARGLFGRPIKKVLVRFSSKSSLPGTYVSQGSETGLMTGLMGMSIEDGRVPDIMEYAAASGIETAVEVHDGPCSHPNTYEIILGSGDGITMRFVGISTGGGMVRLQEVDGVHVSLDGGEDTDIPGIGHVPRVLPVGFNPDCRLPFRDATDFESMSPTGEIWQYAIDYESERSGMRRDDLWKMAVRLVGVMRSSVSVGLHGTEYPDRILGAQSLLVDAAARAGRTVPSALFRTIEKYAMAVMECKSSYGVILAAPTAGSCAVLPAVLISLCDLYGYPEERAAKALLAAGLVGMFIAARSTLSAEVAGCQAECGAASGMAAAGVVQLLGGSSREALAASSFALQNVMGMVCDPVANRVEAPCLGKNIMCAMNAVAAADYVMAGADALLPLGEVIKAMDEVGRSIPVEYRCTGLGGLSKCAASLAIERKLKEKKHG